MKKRSFTAVLFGVYLASLALLIWRTVFMKKYYNPLTYEYDFEASGVLSAFGWITFAVVALIAIFAFLKRKAPSDDIPASSNQFSVFSNAFCGIVFIIAPLIAVIYHPAEAFGLDGSAHAVYKISLLLSLLLMIISGVYFLINASVRLNSRKVKKYISLSLPVWGMFFLCASYFNSEYIYTDDNRILANMAIAASLVLLLLEARSSVGRPQNVLRFAFSLITILLAAVYFIPTVILTAFWEMKPSVSFFLEMYMAGILFYSSSVAVNYISGLRNTEN